MTSITRASSKIMRPSNLGMATCRILDAQRTGTWPRILKPFRRMDLEVSPSATQVVEDLHSERSDQPKDDVINFGWKLLVEPYRLHGGDSIEECDMDFLTYLQTHIIYLHSFIDIHLPHNYI